MRDMIRSALVARPPAVLYRLVEEVERMRGVSSVQITFREDWAPDRHAMPPGGFRLAIVNGVDLPGALAARERLKGHFRV